MEILLAGVCATDLEMVAGYRPDFSGVLGHEFVGRVVSASNEDPWKDQRVVGEINIGCGSCALCCRGLDKYCRKRQTVGIAGRDGVFAEYVTLPTANLHRVPDSVSNEQAVFTEPLAAALQILELVHIRPSDEVAVVGDGRLGLLIAQAAAHTGCRLTVLGRHENHLAFLRAQGADTVLIESSDSIPAALVDSFDIAAEATGAESGFLAAKTIVRPGGVIALKSTFAKPMTSFDVSSLVVDEIRVVGSRCGPFAPALRMLEQGGVEVQPMIHRVFPLNEAVEALEYAGQRGVLKVLVRP